MVVVVVSLCFCVSKLRYASGLAWFLKVLETIDYVGLSTPDENNRLEGIFVQIVTASGGRQLGMEYQSIEEVELNQQSPFNSSSWFVDRVVGSVWSVN